MEAIEALHRPRPGTVPVTPFGLAEAKAARSFHRSLPGYAPTPLVALPGLARALGIESFHVKDESPRFGLNAFKVLGGSFCIARVLAARLGLAPDNLTYEALTTPAALAERSGLTFVTATDGNHGRGIAWTARALGCRSVVYLPRGSSPERLANIRALGADASVTDLLYDDAVRLAGRQAAAHGWTLVQDTSWAGYEEIPTRIMQGYTTMALETTEQLDALRPTHIFLQAGVGAMAGAMAGFFASYYGSDLPVITVVEPHKANCLFRTAQAGDGSLHKAEGPMDTIMAGLACGEPCGVGWKVLDACTGHFLSVPDELSAKGMRILGNPCPGDRPLVSGESGAVSVGTAAQILTQPALAHLRDALELDARSRILCFSTEGDTDRAKYRRIVWDGLYPVG